MCEQSAITDPEILALCGQIISAVPRDGTLRQNGPLRHDKLDAIVPHEAHSRRTWRTRYLFLPSPVPELHHTEDFAAQFDRIGEVDDREV